jgi:hypothetical protein
MMTGLSFMIGASLALFIGSLAYVAVQDWISSRRFFQNQTADYLGQSGHHFMHDFHRAARRPVRFLGSFL